MSSQTARSAVPAASLGPTRKPVRLGALWTCLILGWLAIIPPFPMAWTLPGLGLVAMGLFLALRCIGEKRYLQGLLAIIGGLGFTFLAYIAHFAIVVYLAERAI